ncbi:MAG: ribonuclease P protein component [Chloroflexota bacterium]|nr:ribonuclease P protein component [Chloroflexota bacterium]
MPADQRLRRKSDFDAVFREGEGVASGPLAMRARKRTGQTMKQPCRFGFAVSSRLGGAVQRNRIRRRLRDSARQLNAEGDCEGLDVVVIARHGAAKADFKQLKGTLRGLVGRSMRQLNADRGAS